MPGESKEHPVRMARVSMSWMEYAIGGILCQVKNGLRQLSREIELNLVVAIGLAPKATDASGEGS